MEDAANVDIDADSITTETSVWSFASGMLSQIRSDVGEFVDSLGNENEELVEEVKQQTQKVKHSVQTTIHDASEHTRKALHLNDNKDALKDGGNDEQRAASSQDAQDVPQTSPSSFSGGVVSTIERIGGTLEHIAVDTVTPSVQAFGGKAWSAAKEWLSLEDDEKKEEPNTATNPVSNSALPAGAGLEERLALLQGDIRTYTEDPLSREDDNALTRFNEWKTRFELDEQRKVQCQALIKDSAVLQAFVSELVPGKVAEVEFWCRYWFREEELRREHARRLAFVMKPKAADIELSWGDDMESGDEKSPAQRQSEHVVPAENRVDPDSGSNAEAWVKVASPRDSSPAKEACHKSTIPKQDDQEPTVETATQSDRKEDEARADEQDNKNNDDDDDDDDWENWQ